MQCPLSRAEGRGCGHKSIPRRACRAGLPWSARDVCVSVVMSRHICTADLAVLAGSCPRARRRLTVLGSRFRGSRCVARVRWCRPRPRRLFASSATRRRRDLAVHYLISVNVIRRQNNSHSAKRAVGTETPSPTVCVARGRAVVPASRVRESQRVLVAASVVCAAYESYASVRGYEATTTRVHDDGGF